MRGSTICKQHVILTGVPRGSTGWMWRAARGATAGLKTRWRLVQRLNTAAVSIRYRRLFSLFSGLTDSGFDFIPPMGELSYWLVDGQTVHPITCQVLFESACVLLNSSSVQQTISSRSEMLHRATVWLIELQYHVTLLIWFMINILIHWCFHQPQLCLVFSVSMLIQRWRASWSVLSGVELTADSRQTRILVAAGFFTGLLTAWKQRISAASSVPGVMMERHGASTAAAESVRWH